MNKHLETIRVVLGGFFLLVAILGAIGMVSNLLDMDLLENEYRQFSRVMNNDGGASASNSPFYYSVCLIGGIWLLYGKRNILSKEIE